MELNKKKREQVEINKNFRKIDWKKEEKKLEEEEEKRNQFHILFVFSIYNYVFFFSLYYFKLFIITHRRKEKKIYSEINRGINGIKIDWN